VSNSSNDPVDVELTYTEQELYCAARWLTRVWRGNLFYALLTDLFHCSQPSSMCRHRVFACCACGLRRREASQEDSGDFGRAPCTPERDCGRATTDSNIASAAMVLVPHMTAHCSSCRFWESPWEKAEIGLCRRYAPRPSRRDGVGCGADWPMTSEDDFCGEHEPKQQPDSGWRCSCGASLPVSKTGGLCPNGHAHGAIELHPDRVPE
jgi:hypothetical protein